MVLVDTSIWVDHFRKSSEKLSRLLEDAEVTIHPFVIGDLACGNLKNRHEILALLHSLPQSPRVDDDEVLFFSERHSLCGRGLGLVDMHLLASCQLRGHGLWTGDERLESAAEDLKLNL